VVNAITTAAIPNVVASVVSGAVRLTKSNVTSITSTMAIGGTARTKLGLLSLYNSSSSTIYVSSPLTLTMIVSQINNLIIPNVVANINGTVLQIGSIGQTLEIQYPSLSTVGTDVGIPPSLYQATVSNVTATPTSLQIYDIVTQINAAAISGVTAVNINSNVVILSTNATLTVGAGDANSWIGLSELVYSSRDVYENVFDINEWTQIDDPINFRIWLVNNIGKITQTSVNRKSGYNMYQTFDFNSEILEVCAGNKTGDDALIETVNNHNLKVNDYIVVTNTGCLPQIDGIHRVTGVETDRHFYIDSFIEEKGFGGKIIPLRPTRFNDNLSLDATVSTITPDLEYKQGILGWKTGMLAYVDNVIVNGTPTFTGAVYRAEITNVSGTPTIKFVKDRDQELKVNTHKFKNVKIYNYSDQNAHAQMEIFDPLKGIIPGVIDAEITLKTAYDAATYTESVDENYAVSSTNFWASEKLGTTWWDTENAIYLDYEQSDDEYRQEHWGELYPTSSIDIYEWTKSPVPPDEYSEIANGSTIVDGMPLTGTAYYKTGQSGEVLYYWTEETAFNVVTGSNETYFYFWVKDKTTVPPRNRTYSVSQLTKMLKNPTEFGIDWMSPVSKNAITISNLHNYTDNSGESILQINFSQVENYHQEFMLLAENDNTLRIPEWLHIGLRDSISGTSRYDRKFKYTIWDVNTTYYTDDVVQSATDNNFYMSSTANIGVDPTLENQLSPSKKWHRMYNVEFDLDGFQPKFKEATNELALPVPDPRIHGFSRYGIQTRPRQTWIKNVQSGRRELIQKLNAQLLTINLIDSDQVWNTLLESSITNGLVTYDMRKYWEFVDWHSSMTNPATSDTSDFVVDNISQLITLPQEEGTTATVLTSEDYDGRNRTSKYQYSNAAWQMVFKDAATIQFGDILWDYEYNQVGFDTSPWDYSTFDDDSSNNLSLILDSVRDHIFIKDREPMYTELWMTMLNYINSEQPKLDWAFKTTYVKMIIKHALKKPNKLFFGDNESALIEFVNANKPFHSKLREMITERDTDDNATLTTTSMLDIVLTTPTNEVRLYVDPTDQNVVINMSISTTVAVAIGRDDTEITVTDATQLWTPIGGVNGVVWIDNERIEYAGIVGNTLNGCVRGLANSTHDIGAIVYESGDDVHLTGDAAFDILMGLPS